MGLRTFSIPVILGVASIASAQVHGRTFASIDHDSTWMIVTELHDTLRNCRVDSVRGSEIFLDDRIFTWISVNDIASLQRRSPNHLGRNAVIGSLAGGAAGLLFSSLAVQKVEPSTGGGGTSIPPRVGGAIAGAGLGAATVFVVTLLSSRNEIITLHSLDENSRIRTIRKKFVND